MNIQNLKYALEIDDKRSISKAAKSLYVAQPNLSKSIKELEENCGIRIFKRSSKGVEATKQGRAFLKEAEGIIRKLDELEFKYSGEEAHHNELHISIPRASYVALAVTRYVSEMRDEERLSLYVTETSTTAAINQVMDQISAMAVVRYHIKYDEYFDTLFKYKDIECIPLIEFSYQLLVSKDHPLTQKKKIIEKDLEQYIEILHGDNTLPNGDYVDISVGNRKRNMKKQIYVYERGMQFDLLSRIPDTFMWVSPMPEEILERNGLVAIACDFMGKDMRDTIIYRKGHRFSKDEKIVMEKLNSLVECLNKR